MKKIPILGLGNDSNDTNFNIVCGLSLHVSAWEKENIVGFIQLFKMIFRFLKLQNIFFVAVYFKSLYKHLYCSYYNSSQTNNSRVTKLI